MEELLSKLGTSPKGLSRGQTVSGTVIEVTNKALILDIGAKSEGLVVEREYEAAKAFIRSLKPGDKVEATVVVPEAEGGNPLLSLQKTAEEYVWKSFLSKLKSGEIVEARVEGATRGGLTVNAMGVSGFIPSSHLGSQISENPQASIGRGIQAKVIEVDRSKGRLVLSEKAVSESEFLEKQAELLKKIERGERFAGRVVRVLNFGIFVEIEKDGVPIEGLVHLSELSWQKVSNPAEVYEEGDEVEVSVIGKEQGRLALSIKQTTEDPWTTQIEKYKKEDHAKGRVTKVGDFGAFVELEPGVEGLIHSSKIGEKVLKEGDEVDVSIDEIDKKNHKLSLGLVLKAIPVGYR